MGYPSPAIVQDLMLARGHDLSNHQDRQLTDQLIKVSDLVLVMGSAKREVSKRKSLALTEKYIDWVNDVYERFLKLIDKGVAK